MLPNDASQLLYLIPLLSREDLELLIFCEDTLDFPLIANDETPSAPGPFLPRLSGESVQAVIKRELVWVLGVLEMRVVLEGGVLRRSKG